jgi:hypothetical protein
MRYITAELQLRQMAQGFQLDWEAEKAGWQGQEPKKEQIAAMLAQEGLRNAGQRSSARGDKCLGGGSSILAYSKLT